MTFQPCTLEWRRSLSATFPRLQIEQEYQEMLVWIQLQARCKRVRHPSQRRFVHWLQKSQARLRAAPAVAQANWSRPAEWGQEPVVSAEQIKQLRMGL